MAKCIKCGLLGKTIDFPQVILFAIPAAINVC